MQEFPSFTELLRTGQPGLFQFDSLDLVKAERDHLQQFGTQMMLVIPLEVMGQVIGYAELRESRESREASVEVSELVAQGFQGFVGIPLLHRDQSLGVMSLLKRQPHRASAEDLALLSTVGNQVAVAVANARLFQTINDQHGRSQALIEASRDGVLLIGMDQRVLVTNVLALKLLGLGGGARGLD